VVISIKKILVILIALAIALTVSESISAAGDIQVVVNGTFLDFDVPPQNINGRILVPMRVIFEEMGAVVVWDADTQTVFATKGDMVVVLVIGNCSPTINNTIIVIDQPGIFMKGRTLAPLRFVAEAFGGTVVWDPDDNIATITLDQADGSHIAELEHQETPKPPDPEIAEYQKGSVSKTGFVSEYLNLKFVAAGNVEMRSEADCDSLTQLGSIAMFYDADQIAFENAIDDVIYEMLAHGPNHARPAISVILLKPVSKSTTERQFLDTIVDLYKSQGGGYYMEEHECTYSEYTETTVAGQPYVLLTITDQHYARSTSRFKVGKEEIRDIYVRKQDDRFVCIDVRYTEIDAGHMKDMMRAFKELN
jgi:hypothetical protein